MHIFFARKEEDWIRIAEDVFYMSQLPYWFLFQGEMGAGKTTFIKEILTLLGIEKNIVNSPTYTYVNHYLLHSERSFIKDCYHFDLFRLEDEYEADSFVQEYMELFSHSLVCIEWSEHLSPQFFLELQAAGAKSIKITEQENGVRRLDLMYHKIKI